MRKGIRAALASAAALATLVFAGSALAANTGTIAVSHTPMTLGGSQSTTIHLVLPQADDPIAAVNVYVPAGYQLNLGQSAGTNIGSVDAQAFSHTNGLQLPLGGNVTTDSPSKYTAQSTTCARTPASAAVWILNLSVAGQTLALPLYVNPTSGPEQALGAYKLSICLTPWDIPESLGGAAQGAQLLDAQFTVKGVFTTPSGGGLAKWDAIVTPYTAGKGTPNLAGTFELRGFVPLPVVLGIHGAWVKRTAKWTLSGRATEGGLALPPGTPLTIYKGASPTSLKRLSTTTVKANGSWAASGRLLPRKPTFFQVAASVTERDYTAQGCTNPATAVAPAGCVKASLSAWSSRSPIVRVKP